MSYWIITFNDLSQSFCDELLKEELRGQVILLREFGEGSNAGLWGRIDSTFY
jgi:hypothetical protein